MSQHTPSLKDEELARQAQAGSLEAFETLVWRYENRIYAFVSHCLFDHRDAREVTQDTFIKVFQSIRQFDHRRAFAPWIFAIARRKIIDCQRRLPPVSAEQMPDIVDSNAPDVLLTERDDRAVLWRNLRQWLPDLQYQALWLRYAAGLNVAEIAQALHKTRIHVKVLLFRARQTLCQTLKESKNVAGAHLERESVRDASRNRDCLVRSDHFLSLSRQKELP